MRALCLTVDLDRDVNLKVPGSTAAGSIDRGSGTGPRFSSSGKGLSLLIDLLDDIGMKATFFAEAGTLRKIDASLLSGQEVGIHGVDHEDLTLLSKKEKAARLLEASEAVKDAVGKAPECFRAPYMSVDEETISMLPELGINIDSSHYAEMSKSLMPKKTASGVWEIPVPEGRDGNGKRISAYLWPMHESKRKPEDYIEMASVMEEGAFVIATHTWHIVESREKGIMTSEEVKNNILNVKKVLEGIADLGMKSSTLTEVRDAAANRSNK